MNHEEKTEYLVIKQVFEKDCLEDELFPLTENEGRDEDISDDFSNLRIVTQYQNRNREKQPVFH